MAVSGCTSFRVQYRYGRAGIRRMNDNLTSVPSPISPHLTPCRPLTSRQLDFPVSNKLGVWHWKRLAGSTPQSVLYGSYQTKGLLEWGREGRGGEGRDLT